MASLQRRILDFFFRLTTGYPKAVLAFCLVVAAAASFYTVRNLEFITGRIDMISTDKPYVKLDQQYSNEFAGLDPLIVVVEPEDIEQGKEYAARLGEILKADTRHVVDVLYRIDTATLEGKKLLYLTPAELADLRENIEDNEDLMKDLLGDPGLNSLFVAINRQVSSAMVAHLVSGLFAEDEGEEKVEGEGKPVKIGFLNSLLKEMADALAGPEYRYRSPWSDFFSEKDELSDEGYLVSDNRRFLFLLVEPSEAEQGGFTSRAESIDAIHRSMATTAAEFHGLKAGLTGQQALNNDEMLSARSDTNIATIVSFAGITLLYLLFFKRISHPLVITVTLLVGLAWTMGCVTLTVGHLTIISVFVAPMLLGLADDFAVHFMSRYEEERSRGLDLAASLRIVFMHTVPGIAAGAVSTALAFFAVMLTDFRGVQELGWITGAGLFLYLLITVTFLPALVVLLDRVRPWKPVRGGRTFFTGAFRGLGRVLAGSRLRVLAALGAVTIACLIVLPLVRFDYNLLNLQARGTESVVWEKKIIESSQRSSWRALATGKSLEETSRKAAEFEALPAVGSVVSIASLIPEGQGERIDRVRSLGAVLAGLPAEIARPSEVDVPGLRRVLDKLRLKVREGADRWNAKKKPSEEELREARARLLEVIDRLRGLDDLEAGRRLDRFQGRLFRDFGNKWDLLRNNLDPAGPITLADVPEQLKRRMISKDGGLFLIEIYSKKNIWDREPMEEFIGQLRSVDPDVAGSPIVGYESIRAMKEGYTEAGLYALASVMLVTFLTLRRVRDSLLAVIPLALGMVWTAGWMWLFDLHLNLANLIVVPLIIGIGLENGIHIVHRFREEGEAGPALVESSTGQSVALFSLTTMVGFGSLMVARYYGIFSIGLLLTVSVGSVLIASLTVLPLLLSRSDRNGPAQGGKV